MPLQRPTSEQLDSATPEEVAALAADCLNRLEPGRQPLALFTELTRLVVSSEVQLVPFRAESAGSQVLLGKRLDTDKWWPNQWEVPGVILLANEEQTGPTGYEGPVKRILDSEFKSTVNQTADISVFDVKQISGTRGCEQVVYCLTEVELAAGIAEPAGGAFFDIAEVLTSPPDGGLVEGHAQTLAIAHRHFLATRA